MSLRCKVFHTPEQVSRPADRAALEDSINTWLSTPCYPPDAPKIGIMPDQISHVVMSDSRVLIFYSDAKEGVNLR